MVNPYEALRARLRAALMRMRGVFATAREDRELDEELESHLQLHMDDLIGQGLTPAQARRQALIRLGAPLSVTQAYRERRGLPAVDAWLQDFRLGLRLLRRQRGFSTLAVLTLALGVGAATAMFSIVDAVVLRPFPFAQPDRLVVLWETNAARQINRFQGSVANYVDFESEVTTMTALGAWELRDDNRTDGPAPERVEGAVASAAYFRALELTPQLGRFFSEEEDTASGRFVAVLGHEYWQRAFEGRPDVLGERLVINGEPHTVIGVLPPQRPPFRAAVWRPLAANVAELDRGDHSVYVVGRLAPGETMASAEAELQAVAARLAGAYPKTNEGWSVRLEPIFDAVVQDATERAIWVLMAGVALLLVIACVNVASLTLARATSRLREFSTRLALGAGRSRIVGQLAIEAAILAAAGAALGGFVALWLLDLVQWLYPADIPGLADAALNRGALAFAVAAGALTTIGVGVLPALIVTRRSRPALLTATRSIGDAPRARAARHAFVVAQVALALVLLTGAGLLLQSLQRLHAVPLGFNTDAVTIGSVYYDDMSTYAREVERLLRELTRRPGVAAAGISSSVPLHGLFTVMQARLEHEPEGTEGTLTQWRVIGGDYFSAVGIPVVAGRAFTAADDDSVPRVAVVSRSLARRLWGHDDVIGQRVLVGDGRRPYQVIGVAGPARLTGLATADDAAVYFHYRQFQWPSMTVVVRSGGSAAAVAGVIREAVTAVNPAQPVFAEQTMADVIARAAIAPRMQASLLTLFALVALLLAAIGVYGVMSYTAAQRASEIGLRYALGARPHDVFAMICRQGLRLVCVGIGLGVVAAWLVAPALESLLFETSAYDVRAHAMALAAMIVVAALACVLPARRGMRTDPVTALRHE